MLIQILQKNYIFRRREPTISQRFKLKDANTKNGQNNTEIETYNIESYESSLRI